MQVFLQLCAVAFCFYELEFSIALLHYVETNFNIP